MAPEIEAVIWDMDGVLIDVKWHSPINNEVFRPFGVFDTVEKRAGRFTGMRALDMFRAAIEEHGLDADPQDLFERKLDLLEQRVGTHMRPTEGAVDLVTHLASLQVPMAVASSTGKRAVTKVLEKLGVLDHVAFHLGGDEVRRGKPHPDIFLEAAGLLDKAPESCVVVEDSKHGIEAARAAGMKVIGFGPKVRGMGDYSAENMEEVQKIMEPWFK